MRTGAGELAAVDDQIFRPDRAVFEPAFEDLAGAGRVACLRRLVCLRSSLYLK
jgi:hypothetical protein